jgi:hypothetical protein
MMPSTSDASSMLTTLNGTNKENNNSAIKEQYM